MRYCFILLPILCGGCGHSVVSEKLLDAVIQGRAEYEKSQVEILGQLADLQKQLQTVAKRQSGPGKCLTAAITVQARLLEELIKLQNQGQVTTTRQTNQGDKLVNYAKAQLERLEQLHRQQAELYTEIEALTSQQAECAKREAAFLIKPAELARDIHVEMQKIQSQAKQPKDRLIHEKACLCDGTGGQNACRL